MVPSTADRNLLFGILALQMDFVSRDQLVAAMHAWVLAKSKSLGQILREQGALSPDRGTLLEALVAEHLKQHGNDAEKSLAAVGSPHFVREELQRIADPDVQASLKRVPAIRIDKADPYGTVMRSVGAPSATGTRFRILRPHARGGLGEVLVAHDEELHREVVVKQIQQQHADDAESRSRFVMEAEITGGLEHPGIVPVYGKGQYADGRPFYAMRFVRGDSLKDAIERFHKKEAPGRDPGERSLEFRKLLGRMIDVCEAIAYAHSRSVLHRDLKPGNIMLGKYGETLVVDWGLAKPLDRPIAHGPVSEEGRLTLTSASGGQTTPTVMGTAMGTPQFMSPEQAAGRLDQLGPASDVYSLGATLYCLLTGQTPFPDPDVGEVLQKVQRGEVTPPRQVKPDVPPALEAICLKAMALKPQDRYPSPQLLAEDLEHWLGDEPVSAWRESWTVRAKRWLRRHQALAVGIASAIIVALIGLGVATVLLTAANEREREAKRNAEHNFQMAKEAVDRYHTDVSESILLREPGQQPLRKQLLEAAKEFYDRFAKERKNDPAVKGELGRALFRLAQITADIESEAKAIELAKQALQIFIEQKDGYQSDIARCYYHLGRLYRLTDQLSKAEEEFKKAASIWDTLVGREPKYQAELARSRLGLGNVYQQDRQIEQAQLEYVKALETWARLEKEASGTESYERDLATTQSNLGMVHVQRGAAKEAQQAFERASAIQDKLARDHPNITQYADDLARSRFNLGDLHFQKERLAEAGAAYQAAATGWDKLVESHPAVLLFKTRRAEVYAKLANVYRKAQKFAEAVDACKQALATRQELAEKNRNVPSYRGDVARGYFQLGDAYRDGGQLGPAQTAYAEAVKLQEALLKELPNEVVQYQADLARTYTSLGLLRQAQEQSAPAEEAFARALSLWESLHEKRSETAEFVVGMAVISKNLRNLIRLAGIRSSPDVFTVVIDRLEKTPASARTPEVRQALREAYWTRGETQALRGKYGEALADCDRALAIAGTIDLRLFHALTLTRSGDHAQAIARAQELTERVAGSGERLYQLGCIYAVAVEAVTKDTSLSPDKARELAEQHGKRAVEWLSKAREAGYFRTPAPQRRLTIDPEFQYLRARADFQKMLREIETEGASGK